MNSIEQHTTKVTDVMDLMAGFKLLTYKEKREVLQQIIDVFCDYSKPQQKGDTEEPKNNVLGAYLCVSNIRNACKLGLLHIWSMQTVYKIINYNLEDALTSLIMDVKIKFPEKVIIK